MNINYYVNDIYREIKLRDFRKLLSSKNFNFEKFFKDLSKHQIGIKEGIIINGSKRRRK